MLAETGPVGDLQPAEINKPVMCSPRIFRWWGGSGRNPDFSFPLRMGGLGRAFVEACCLGLVA